MRAAAELSSTPTYAGPRDAANQVTPGLLFRGGLAGETVGPYVSQFLLQPTALGSLPITRKYIGNKAGEDFMTGPAEFLNVQNGIPTGKSLTPGTALYLHNGRDLAAYTHDDVLYQAYLIAYLVLTHNQQRHPGDPEPGNPYIGSSTQNGFGTLGQPDIAATLVAVAGKAIREVWYQKWWMHLRHRPESGGAIVYLQKTGQGGTVEGHVSDTVLNSQAGRPASRQTIATFCHKPSPKVRQPVRHIRPVMAQWLEPASRH